MQLRNGLPLIRHFQKWRDWKAMRKTTFKVEFGLSLLTAFEH
jgi:hypothetical protein